MGMVKIVNPGGWDFNRPTAQVIKISSRGLIGNDRSEFLKVASCQFLDDIDSIKVAKDEVPIHLIALGAYEAYGPNRNGDGFKEAELKSHHNTFVKHAKWYRNHKNKDPQKSYGIVKKSAYHDAMRRVELLCMLNKEASAAERNGGFVADLELEKIAAGEDIPVSMACRVPYDICSGCGNKARTRADYCTKEACAYGGCKSNLTKLADDGHILSVLNPSPSFFDISKVYRPADRIAWGAKADYLTKAASSEFPSSEAMVEALGITAPLSVVMSQSDPWGYSDRNSNQVKLASILAQVETLRLKQAYLDAMDPQLTDPVPADTFNLLGCPGTEKSAATLNALASRKVLLPLRDFARWVGKERLTHKAAEYLPTTYRDLTTQHNFEQLVANNPFVPSRTKQASAVEGVLARNLWEKFAADEDCLQERLMRRSLRQQGHASQRSSGIDKSASDIDPEVKQLVQDYGLYKLAGLERIMEFDNNFLVTGRLAIAQNCV